MRRLMIGLRRDDGGQDLIEYALLAALIGTVGIIAWHGINGIDGINKLIETAYTGWDEGVQRLSSCTPNPNGGGC